jgi:hypothetical protein
MSSLFSYTDKILEAFDTALGPLVVQNADTVETAYLFNVCNFDNNSKALLAARLNEIRAAEVRAELCRSPVAEWNLGKLAKPLEEIASGHMLAHDEYNSEDSYLSTVVPAHAATIRWFKALVADGKKVAYSS